MQQTKGIVLFVLFLASTAPLAPPAASAAFPEELIKEGHWKQARALVEPQYKAHPDDGELNYLMSEIADAFGDLEKARQLAERAVALKGNESRYHRQLADVDGQNAQTASLFAQAGWAKKFKAEAETAASLDPKNLNARFELLEYDLQAPRLLGGGKGKAAAMAAEIAGIDPAQGDLAQARLAQDRKDAAGEESWYRKALEAKPGDYEVLIDLASFYASPTQAKLELAEKYARQASQADPGRVEAHALLASVLASRRRWNDLDTALARADKSVPDDLDPYYRAGLAILTGSAPGAGPAPRPDLSRAEGYFRHYLSAKPEGNEPTWAHAHWRLGDVLEKEGRKAEAVSELKMALALKPDLKEAKKDLKRLE